MTGNVPSLFSSTFACKSIFELEQAPLNNIASYRLPEDHEYVQAEIQEMSAQLEAEKRLTGDASASTLWKELVTIPGNRKRAIISVLLMICQQMTGVNAVNYYAPQIFQSLGMTGTTVSLFATGVYGIVKVLGCAAFLIFCADSLGRRRSLLWTSAAQALTMYIIGIYGRVEPPVAGQGISAFGYVAIVCIYLWAALFQFGWGPCCWILVSEIPTARLRALNVAIGAATQWLFNFIIARTVLTMQKTMGPAGYVSIRCNHLDEFEIANQNLTGYVLHVRQFRSSHGYLCLVLRSRDQGSQFGADGRALWCWRPSQQARCRGS